MIERMHKYLFLIFHTEYEEFLKKIQSLGVVHIKETKSQKDFEDLQVILKKRKDLETLISKIKIIRTKDAPEIELKKINSENDGEEIINYINSLFESKKTLENQIISQKKELDYWNVWGDYDLEQIKLLEKNGYKVQFYTSPSNQFNDIWEKENNAIIIKEIRSVSYFITIGDPSSATIDAELIPSPQVSLDNLRNKLEELETEKEKIDSEIISFANLRLGELLGYDLFLESKYSFSNAFLQAEHEAEGSVKVLEGWVPENNKNKVDEDLSASSYFFKEVEILDEDSIPVKLKNNRYGRLFESITKMYSLPNYGEVDITSLMAPFFMLFFALCFGDGGYGVILLLFATIARIKTDKQSGKQVAAMMQWLGGTSVIIGFLMGTVFGMTMPWAGDNLLGSVSKEYFLNQDNMMSLSVALGVIQIIFGKFIAGYKNQKQRGFAYGLANYAWGIVIIMAALGMILKNATKIPYAEEISLGFYGIAGLSFLVALLFNTPKKNIFINIGSGLWATYNNASGLLGDTLSYIRLFAIGLTGGILGGVFNKLAIDLSADLPTGVNFLVMGLILLFGHSLNFGLCMISSLVHPLRLTFVEFYKNAEFEGGGKEYTPFKSL